MKFRPWHLLVLAALVIVAMTAFATGGDQPGSVATDGDIITKTVSRSEPTNTSTFEITLLEGGDAEHESVHIFQGLELPGIATVALDTSALSLTIAYDGSIITEDQLRQNLAQTGYLKRTVADAVAAEMAADGSGQTIHLVPGEVLEPSFVRAVAGVPLTITFSPGQAHLASVSIPSLGITQDITAEGSAIRIEQPVAGTYELVCAEGYADGTLVVE